MGLIKTLTSSVSTALGDQFKEYVTCPDVGQDVLIVRGVVKHGDGNKNPSEGVISNGSVIVVPQGWAMMLVDNGKVEFSSEPGEFTYDSGSEPTIFSEGLGKGIIDTFKTIGKRFTFGGQTARDQRVYYINMREVQGIKFGSSSPKDIYDETYQMSIKMTFYGTFKYKVDNPLALVSTVFGANPSDHVTFTDIFGDSFKSEVNEQMHKALTLIMAEKKCRFSQIGLYGSDISEELNKIMSEKWAKYGVVITEISMENIGTTDEYTEIIRGIESKANEARIVGQTYSDNMAGTMAAATAEAMKNASSNENGAMMGFAGFNMSQTAGASVMATANNIAQNNGTQGSAESSTNVASSNFCPNCGTKTNGSNFCPNCGTKLN